MSEQAAKTNTSCRKLNASEIAVIAVFLGFIAVFSLLLLFLPKHEGELSPNERRVLAEAPSVTAENIFSGRFSKEVDSWLQDHFPARSGFVAVYSYLNRATGRNASEEVILGSGDRLFERPIPVVDENIDYNVGRIRDFVADKQLRAYTYIIPTGGYMLESALPKPHLAYHDGEIIKRYDEAFAGSLTPISAEDTLKAADSVDELYYRTDHHLTMRGSYVSYCAIAKELGFEPLPESEFTKTGYDFYGTYYGRSGLFLLPPDTLETWVGSYDAALKVTIVEGENNTEYTGSLDETKLAADVADKYAAYLYSNHGVTVIENPEAEGGSLLVVKDSYGNAIVPFLAAHYRTIVMLDLRTLYYGPFYETPTQLCEKYGISDFLLLVGLDTVANGTLNWLR